MPEAGSTAAADGAAGLARPVAVGATVVVRDEEWLVQGVMQTEADGLRVDVRGTSELVRDQSATFLTALDAVEVLDPTKTILVPDESANYIRSRLWLEALLRESPLPMSDTRIVAGHQGLQDRMDFQLRPAHMALTNPYPRILIADAVGLGKTLEIGILLSDLIRRGRGERILVVTPRAVLEQFQHEMWTKFAIPLVRLDSEGIQKVRQTLPASRNPFSYYRRVIVSIDTLKNPVRYRHHLQAQHWDAVVIDECHNLINPGTQNHELAKLLARNTDALILASATPHNGKPESFAELIRMLDPTAIKDPSAYAAADISHLFVRRHRNSPDVSSAVGDKWAARLDPTIIPVTANAAEETVLSELQSTWLRPSADSPLRLEPRRRLFPWTLLKSFLSSTHALRQTIDNRLRSIGDDPDAAAERTALQILADLNEVAAEGGSSKLHALVDYLTGIGVGRGKPTRVVVFSERIRTLTWLLHELRTRMRLHENEIALLHAQLPDHEVQSVVESFGLASSPLRVLLASDMASEGLNLHLQCHHLVHMDVPWSFIRIHQRAGRVDRYLQTKNAQITALALTSRDPDRDSELRVVTKLLQKEHAANQALGDAAVLLDLHDADLEEEAVMRALLERRDLDQALPGVEQANQLSFDFMFADAGQHEDEPAAPVADQPTLFRDDDDYLYAALTDLYPRGRGLNLTREGEALVAFDTPDDLAQALRELPASYRKDRDIDIRIRLTGDRDLALSRLQHAKDTGDTLWPDVHYLGSTHPVLRWVSSRILARLGRNQAPVLAADVPGPVFLTQAVWSNRHGQAAIARWSAISGLDSGEPVVADLVQTLIDTGITHRATNPGAVADLPALQALVPAAVAAATEDLHRRRAELEEPLRERIQAEEDRVQDWTLFTLEAADDAPTSRRRQQRQQAEQASTRALEYLDSLRPSGEPFVRVVGVIAPTGSR